MNLKNLTIRKEKPVTQEVEDSVNDSVVSIENGLAMTPTPNRNIAEKIRPESDIDESCQQNYIDAGDPRKIDTNVSPCPNLLSSDLKKVPA